VDVLLERASRGEPGGYTFLADGETESASLSWAALAERVGAVSVAVRAHAGPGDRALMLFPPGLDFLVAFLGCLHAGIVAVPCVPPRRPLRRSLDRIGPLVESARPALIVASGPPLSIVGDLRVAVPGLAGCPVIDPRDLAACDPVPASHARPDDVAFLQFTSGSTSAPKGVMVSHANLMHNLAYIHRQVAHDRDSVSLTWLPAYHDMGLVDGMLEPVFGGFRSVAMPPHAFLQRPVRWLRAIGRYRATHSGGPNFAYDLCVERISASEMDGVDLSSWRFAHNGAEPIRVPTLDAFARRFGPAGFRRDAFYLCYGLAEATVSVSGGALPGLTHRVVDADALEAGVLREPPDEDATARTRTVASCGTASAFDLAIVNPETGEVLPEGGIGEIWVSGPSVAAGYFEAPQETQDVFRAQTQDGRGPFLRTGDLGFVKEGQLYVAGRCKDLIVLSGRNLYPHDLELSASRAHEALRGGSAVAFSTDDGKEEQLVVLVEVNAMGANLDDVAEAVRLAIVRDHEVDVAVVGLVRHGDLLKTSSGKIRRHACRREYLEGRLRLMALRDPPALPVASNAPEGHR
jgi:acyl-CoA synthetase (AMP-forming)/AMP-acid ligase II